MSVQKLSRYELIAIAAQGKLGPICDGYDPDIRRKVTVKVAPVEHLSEQAAEALALRFRTEARVAGKLLHPNIVGVYDAGVESGLAYIVTETVTGASLDAMLRQPGGVPQELVGRIAVQMLAALDYAHSKDVAHLGLQPSQVMVTPSGTVKISDFGAVAAAEPDDATRSQGSLSEHIRCLAPEQVLGLQADARADLWAVGVLLYRMWTGQWPFNAESDFGLIQKIIKQMPPTPSTLLPSRLPAFSAEHDHVIARALAKAAAERYQTAREFAADLSRIVAREAGTAASVAAVLPRAQAPEPPTDDERTRIMPPPINAAGPAIALEPPVVAAAAVAPDPPRVMAPPMPTPTVEPAQAPVVSAAAPAAASPGALPSAKPRRGWIAALAGLLILGAGAAMLFSRGTPTPAVDAIAPAPAASSPTAAAPADPPPAVTASAASAAVEAPASAPPTPSTPSTPALAAVAPSAAASREQLVRKVAADAAALRARKAASAPVFAAPPTLPSPVERPTAAAAVEAPKPIEVQASAAPTAPTEPCGKRVLLARLACMKEACVKAEWVRHPQCVE